MVSHLSRESGGRRDEAEVGTRMASRRYLGATLIWALRTIRRTLYSMRVYIDWKPMEMSLNVRKYMGVTGKSGNGLHSDVEYSLKGR